MKKFNRVTIIGVGLIGGSIGLAVRKRRIARQVIGVFRHETTLKKALKRKAIDRGVLSIEEGVKDADLIIIATPVLSIPVLAREAARYAKKGALMTDAGSTKKWLVNRIEKTLHGPGSVLFVGSHPMAGSEHVSVDFARSDLLEGSPCIVTRTRRTRPAAVRRVSDFWKALGGKVAVMSPEEHDRIVSLISHLPHIVAFSLAAAVPGRAIRYAAEGFKDTTRVASSDPEMWAEIFLSNRSAVLGSARVFTKFFNKLVHELGRGEYGSMVKFLRDAKTKRDRYINA
jgi:prephenate dehydrogenase